jgi:hypothetical protein
VHAHEGVPDAAVVVRVELVGREVVRHLMLTSPNKSGGTCRCGNST